MEPFDLPLEMNTVKRQAGTSGRSQWPELCTKMAKQLGLYSVFQDITEFKKLAEEKD
jgi:hypothetical protein